MTNKILSSQPGCYAFVAGVSGFMASITANLPEADKIEAVGKWPLTVVLGAVCCFIAYLKKRHF